MNFLENQVGVSIILLNSRNQVLLQLRDDIEGIDYPGYWGLIGGGCKLNEAPKKAIIREVYEEINYNLKQFKLLRQFYQNGIKEYAYISDIDMKISELEINEGKALMFESLLKLDKYKIRDDDLETLKYFINKELLT